MREQRNCPITGGMAEYEPALASGLGHRFYQSGSFLAIGEGAYIALQGGLWAKGAVAYSPNELLPARALIRSKFWRTARDGSRPLLVLTAHEARQFESGQATNSQLVDFHVVILEEAVAEAENLTFTEKALNTLENLYAEWRRSGKIPGIPYGALDHNRHTWFRTAEGVQEDGMAYGCDELTAPIVYRWLQDQFFIIDRVISGVNLGLELGPNGMIAIDAIKQGREAALRRGFFIRRFDPATDAFFRPILDEVMRATGCDISAVWEKQKNEKLDELILRRIRESSVIVLDVTGERFNVGLEAGYALALRKQIVLLRDAADPLLPTKPGSPHKHFDVPFDIRTLNCFFYDRDKPEEIQKKLTERVLDALEEAKIGTH